METFHSALLLVPFVVEATGLADAVANETEDTHCKPLPGNGISARHRPCSRAATRCRLTSHGAQLARVLTLLVTSSKVFFLSQYRSGAAAAREPLLLARYQFFVDPRSVALPGALARVSPCDGPPFPPRPSSLSAPGPSPTSFTATTCCRSMVLPTTI